MASEKCGIELIHADKRVSLFGSAPKVCASSVRRDAHPHACGHCHAMVDGIRCTSTAEDAKSKDKSKVRFCGAHAKLS